MGQTLIDPLTGSEGEPKYHSLSQAWLVLMLALVCGAALAAVQVSLGGVIAANKLNETLERIPELVWGVSNVRQWTSQKPSVAITPGTVTVKKEGKTSYYQVFRVVREGNLSGWVIKAGGQGFAGKIELLIGLDPQLETITGLFVLEQKETPGLGNKITFSRWRDQFVRKKTDRPLVVVKSKDQMPNAIDAITGATISSRGVAAIVNRTIGDLKGQVTPALDRFSERRL